MAELDVWAPRYADLSFGDSVAFHGTTRAAEVRTLGPGHTAEDVAVALSGDGVAFIGDVGFFGTQPFLSDCDLDGYRRQLRGFLEADFPVLVPGHGPVGGRTDVERELGYMDAMEDLIGKVVARGGSLDEAKAISLPTPFDGWLVGGMNRFTANLEFMFRHLGGHDAGVS